MTYIETIEKKISKTLDLTKKVNRERWRNHVDTYVSAQEKLLNPELLLEVAADLNLINFVVYKGKKYPTRHLNLEDDGFDFTAYIASEELCEAFGEPDEWDRRANGIDSTIYHYVSPEVMLMEAKEIAKEHLDEPFELINEVF